MVGYLVTPLNLPFAFKLHFTFGDVLCFKKDTKKLLIVFFHWQVTNYLYAGLNPQKKVMFFLCHLLYIHDLIASSL